MLHALSVSRNTSFANEGLRHLAPPSVGRDSYHKRDLTSTIFLNVIHPQYFALKIILQIRNNIKIIPSLGNLQNRMRVLDYYFESCFPHETTGMCDMRKMFDVCFSGRLGWSCGRL